MYIHLKPQAKANDSRLQTCLLYGLGGIGKTQIAVEFVYRYKLDYDRIFWIDGSTEVNLAERYSAISELVDPNHSIKDGEAAIPTLNQWLTNTGKTGKLVLRVITQLVAD